jgi:hypothetical protein
MWDVECLLFLGEKTASNKNVSQRELFSPDSGGPIAPAENWDSNPSLVIPHSCFPPNAPRLSNRRIAAIAVPSLPSRVNNPPGILPANQTR